MEHYVTNAAVVAFLKLPLAVLVASRRSVEERGWFGFAVEDYRDEHISWALIFVAKDWHRHQRPHSGTPSSGHLERARACKKVV
eukprot:1957061-Alexandrium_andersonii.AAC.1